MSNKKLFATEHQTNLAQSNCNNESDSSKGTRFHQSQDIPQRQNYQKEAYEKIVQRLTLNEPLAIKQSMIYLIMFSYTP